MALSKIKRPSLDTGIDDNSNATAITIDSSENIGIGTSSPARQLDIYDDGTNSQAVIAITAQNTDNSRIMFADTDDNNIGILDYNHSNDSMRFVVNNSERMHIDSSGHLIFGHSAYSFTTASVGLVDGNTNHKYIYIAHTSTNSGESPLYINRQSSDGELIQFRQANAHEGSISVSGTTVSYNGGHLSRWSRLADNSKDTSIVKGTVMTNLDQMVVWTHSATDDADEWTEDNEQLNCMAVSSVEGDANVAGVFVNWDNDDDGFNDMNIAMTGDMVIRIAQGTTVARGDLLMSAGDGTAKPQGDDIVRSKTIAKVTSTTVSHTYDDGSYLVPCVLMAC